MFLKNRYDLLIGNPGRFVVNNPFLYLVHGGRGMGKTNYLLTDLKTVHHPPLPRICFVSATMHLRSAAKQTFEGRFGNWVEPKVFVDVHTNLRGREFDYLYWDDFDHTPTNILPIVFDVLKRVTKKIIISVTEIPDNNFFDAQWQIIELSYSYQDVVGIQGVTGYVGVQGITGYQGVIGGGRHD